MITEIMDSFYKIEIPLPFIPDVALKTVNSYVIKAPKCNLIIDTGIDVEPCITAMQSSLKKLAVDLRKTNFFITHFHIDHLNLVRVLKTDDSQIFFNKPDAERVASSTIRHHLGSFRFAPSVGFPKDALKEVIRHHPGYNYRSNGLPNFTLLKDNDILSVGDYTFSCIETPGHTRGHMCLHEANKKIFIAGDHLLDDITPTIQLWCLDENPLDEYMASLDKICDLDIGLVLPGHRNVFRNCRERIQQLKVHHRKRAQDVLSVLEGGPKNAYQIASQVSWETPCDSLDLAPAFQKWLATGEIMAHLKYLEGKGLTRMEMHEQDIVFALNEDNAGW